MQVLEEDLSASELAKAVCHGETLCRFSNGELKRMKFQIDTELEFRDKQRWRN